MLKHFLIPADGSPATRKAAKAGTALSRRLGAKKRVDNIGKLSKVAGLPLIMVVAKAFTPNKRFAAVAIKCKRDVIFMASHVRTAISSQVTHGQCP